jgi:UDPglucose--hexose-1-phosphate uridylyltransferase
VWKICSAFRDRTIDLQRDDWPRHILLFKNHGEAAGATPSTRTELIALPAVPRRFRRDGRRAQVFRILNAACSAIARQEADAGQRIVVETDLFLAIEPYAPRFPFETWIVPRRHASHFEQADHAVLQNLAWVTRLVLRKLDRVLERPAYNLVVHTAPVQEAPMPHYHWHIEIIPKLTKAAGFEFGAGFHINPTPPEEAAQFLREAVTD